MRWFAVVLLAACEGSSPAPSAPARFQELSPPTAPSRAYDLSIAIPLDTWGMEVGDFVLLGPSPSVTKPGLTAATWRQELEQTDHLHVLAAPTVVGDGFEARSQFQSDPHERTDWYRPMGDIAIRCRHVRETCFDIKRDGATIYVPIRLASPQIELEISGSLAGRVVLQRAADAPADTDHAVRRTLGTLEVVCRGETDKDLAVCAALRPAR